jgi:hypothetical protein
MPVTSAIPTLAASATRAGDQVNVTAASINYSATAGSWWVDMNLLSVANSQRVIGYVTGSVVPISIYDATTLQLYDGVSLNKAIGSTVGVSKVAMAFASGDRALTGNGLAPATDATAGIALGSPGAAIGFGYNPANGITQINGYLRQLRYVPRRKTGAEMQAETT